jgi:putative MATE family efflux protein
MSKPPKGFDPDRPYATIRRLAWPQVLMMFAHFFVGFVDVYVAGKLSSEVQASLGVITSSMFFMLIIAISVANGAVAAISQSIGAGKERRAGRYVGLSLSLAVGAGILIMGIGWLVKGLFLDLLQIPPEIKDVARYFLSVYLLVIPAYYTLIVTNAVFRARKEVFFPLYAMIVIMVANTLGDFGLGLGMWGLPALGHKGLAWATFGSVCVGTAFNLSMFKLKGLLKKASFPPLRWSRRAVPYLFKVAWPAGLMQVLWQTGYLVLFAITAALPVEPVQAMAAMTAGLRVESLLFLPGFAFNMTASVLVGHYLGAGQPEEAKRYGYRIWAIGVVLISLATLGVWQFAEPIAGLLTAEAAVREEMVRYLAYNMAAIPFTLTVMIMGGAFVGAGATLYNMAIFGGTVWLLRLPLAYILGHLVFEGAVGIWMAQFTSQFVQACIVLAVFRWGNWTRFAMAGKRRKKAESGLPHRTVPGAVQER